MKIKNQIIKLMCLFAVAFTTFSCTSDDNNKEIAKLPTILEIAQADPANFSILIEALKTTSLTPTVSGQGSYTVFAPTNTAFTAAGFTEAGIKALNPAVPADATTIASLKKILQNHILGVGTKADDLLTAGYVKTFASGSGTGTTLSMFVNKSGADVLVNGGSTNGGAKVTKADIDASNGIVHVVDSVILLPTILNHAIANPAFSTLVSVVTSTGGTFGDQTAVKTALMGATAALPLTVFAPLNSAFDTATGTGGFLTGAAVTTPNVTKVLQYHVSAGNLASSSATSWTSSSATANVSITTLSTQKFSIQLGTVKITELPAITAPASLIKVVNVQATNGIVHAIDRVLQPVL
jgi:uncharacterized surface protein with fasciclin (FAS1) repeats